MSEQPVVSGEIVISFESTHSYNNRWSKRYKMFNGEWVALQAMKKLIRMKLFPIVYRELLPRPWDKSWYRHGFSRILITYGEKCEAPYPFECNCKYSDSWRCAVDQNLHGVVACGCSCHFTKGRRSKWG